MTEQIIPFTEDYLTEYDRNVIENTIELSKLETKLMHQMSELEQVALKALRISVNAGRMSTDSFRDNQDLVNAMKILGLDDPLCASEITKAIDTATGVNDLANR